MLKNKILATNFICELTLPSCQSVIRKAKAANDTEDIGKRKRCRNYQTDRR